jgi:hypothetical protein
MQGRPIRGIAGFATLVEAEEPKAVGTLAMQFERSDMSWWVLVGDDTMITQGSPEIRRPFARCTPSWATKRMTRRMAVHGLPVPRVPTASDLPENFRRPRTRT